MRIRLSDLHSLFLHLFSNFEALYLEVSNIIRIFATERCWIGFVLLSNKLKLLI